MKDNELSQKQMYLDMEKRDREMEPTIKAAILKFLSDRPDKSYSIEQVRNGISSDFNAFLVNNVVMMKITNSEIEQIIEDSNERRFRLPKQN